MGFQLCSSLKDLGGSGSKGSWNKKHSEMAFTSRWCYYFKILVNCFSQISEEAPVTLGNVFFLEEYCISCTY